MLGRLVGFLESQSPDPIGRASRSLAPKLALAKAGDPRVHALMHLVVTRNTSFCVYDVAVFPECFLREPWDAAAIEAGDVCLAKNGGGDLYIWNAERGDVRFVIHDDADQVDEADDAYLARLCFAIELAGDGGLDAEVCARLVDKGLL